MLAVLGITGIIIIGYLVKNGTVIENIQIIVIGLLFMTVIGLVALFHGSRRHLKKFGLAK